MWAATCHRLNLQLLELPTQWETDTHAQTDIQLYFYWFSGYGNKPTDVTAYRKVDIPTTHIFIINKIGNLKHQVCESVSTSYKEGEIVCKCNHGQKRHFKQIKSSERSMFRMPIFDLQTAQYLPPIKEQCQLVDHYFPPVRTLRPSSKNQFLYWRDPMPSVDLGDLK